MARFAHPRIDDVPLAAALHALSDPCRLAIVRRLAEGGEFSCSAATCHEVPKSTLSNHFRILREAGLVHTRHAGRDHLNILRRDEFDRRFPGLLGAVLSQAAEAASA